MKKLLSLVLLLACSAVSYAQNEVTQFLGIPVDGSKSEMIQNKGIPIRQRIGLFERRIQWPRLLHLRRNK